MRVSRRVLFGAGATVAGLGVAGGLVEHETLPGRTRLHELLGLNGSDGTIPDVTTGPVERGTLTTRHVPTPPEWVLAYPPGSAPGDELPVVVVLHYAGSSASGVFDTLGLAQFLAASGVRMALAAVDGGAHSYWHARADGADPATMVLDDLLPMLGGRGLLADRPGLLGWSMGGAGALALAAQLREGGVTPGPVLAVSPALWLSYDEASPGAYDDQDDWAEMQGRIDLTLGAEQGDVRVGCGTGDPFYRHVRELVDLYPVETHYEPGDHTPGYWTRVLPDQLDWLGRRVVPA